MISNCTDFEKGVIIAVTDIGANHRALLMPNQDAYNYTVIDGDFFLAVSDGVGSCRFAEKGAQKCVNICSDIFRDIKNRHLEFTGKVIVDTLLERWKNSFYQDIDSYCTTLKAVFKIENEIIAISIGDGLIVITSDGLTLTAPITYSDFINETDCIGRNTQRSDFWMNSFHLDTNKSYAVFCCTDGVANGLITDSHLDLVMSIEKEVKSEDLQKELENLVLDISEYHYDDKTIGVVKYEG